MLVVENHFTRIRRMTRIFLGDREGERWWEKSDVRVVVKKRFACFARDTDKNVCAT
jgi:hypothetical protein